MIDPELQDDISWEKTFGLKAECCVDGNFCIYEIIKSWKGQNICSKNKDASISYLALTCDNCDTLYYIQFISIVWQLIRPCDDPCDSFLNSFEDQLGSGESDPSKFACRICGKSFSLQRLLNRHMKCHSDTKRYLCTFCGKAQFLTFLLSELT